MTGKSSKFKKAAQRVVRVKPSLGGEQILASAPLPLSIAVDTPPRKLVTLLRIAGTFYGSQFAFRTRLPPPKQMADNLPLMYPSLNQSEQKFVLEIAAALERESRLLDELLKAVPGLKQSERDLDAILLFLLFLRLEAFGIKNVAALCQGMPTKMATLLTFCSGDLTRQGVLFGLLIKHRDLRCVERRILEPIDRMQPEFKKLIAKIETRKARRESLTGEIVI